MAKNADVSSRIDWLFKLAFSRKAKPDEQRVIKELLQSHLEHYELHPDEAEKLISIGQSTSKENVAETALAQRAAWTSVCRAVINMHEFVLRK